MSAQIRDDDFECLVAQRVSRTDQYRPLILRPQSDADMRVLLPLLRDPQTEVHDTLLAQLGEMVRIGNPGQKFSPAALAAAARERLHGVLPVHYGVWVYYPWARRVIHLLDEPEFVAVRTSRNQYKITPEEQQALTRKRIGVGSRWGKRSRLPWRWNAVVARSVSPTLTRWS
jgi:hypothetical protein